MGQFLLSDLIVKLGDSERLTYLRPTDRLEQAAVLPNRHKQR